MAQALQQKAVDVTLFCKTGDDREISAYYGITHPFDITRTNFRSRLSLAAYLSAMSSAAKPMLALGRYAYASLWSARRGVPTIYEVHAPASGLKMRAEQLLFSSSYFIGLIAITDALAKEYYAKYPFLEQRCIVLPDAANDPGACALPTQSGPLTVGYVGSWFPGRGIELIVELARRSPATQFVVAGGEPKQLLEMGLRVPPNLACKGYIPPGEVDTLLRQTDLLLAPYARTVKTGFNHGLETTRWCSPMKLFEYMAHGKAIICSDLPVLREVMMDGKNCLLAEPENVASWESALFRLENDRALAARLGSAARSQFLDRHTWSERAERILSFAERRQSAR